jgi:hypothetical protein
MKPERIHRSTLPFTCLAALALSMSAGDAAANASEGLALEGSYLEGAWCFTHTDYNGEIEDEQVNYRFGSDGDLAVQTSRYRDALKEGFTWEMDGVEFRMSHMPGTSRVVSLEPDEFVLRYFVNLHFVRGVCT